MSRRWYVLLLMLASLQLLGALLGVDLLRALAKASVASPLPKVFTASAGLESFSSRYLLRLRSARGDTLALELTPSLYARVAGPYNRRNAYGAVVAYGPQLHHDVRTRAAFRAVARHALCGPAPLLRELGVPSSHFHGPHTLLHLARPGTRAPLALQLEIACP